MNAFWRIPIPKKAKLTEFTCDGVFFCRRQGNDDDNKAKSYTGANLFPSCGEYLLRVNNNNARITSRVPKQLTFSTDTQLQNRLVLLCKENLSYYEKHLLTCIASNSPLSSLYIINLLTATTFHSLSSSCFEFTMTITFFSTKTIN